MRSLIRRTIAVVLLAELCCAVAFSGATLLHERRTRLRAFDVMLQGRSDSLLGAVQDAEDPDDNVTIDPAELRVSAEDVYAVYNMGGRLLGASRNAPAELIGRRRDGFSDQRAGGHDYRIFQRGAMRVIDRAENGGVGLQRPVTIIYAAPLDNMWHGIVEAVSFYVLVSVALFALTAGLMILLLRRVLEPIQELAIQAAAVSMKSLEFVAPKSALEISELQPLASTLTATVKGLRQAFEKEHRFVSDAAHELKTAVAVVRSTIQVLMLKSRSQKEYTQGLERLLLDNQRVEGLVTQMLLLARLEEKTGVDPIASDISIPVRRAVGSLRSFAEEHAVDLVTAIAADLPIPLSPNEVEVLISNLVVNAVQHSSRGAAVEITLVRSGQSAVLRVRDEGAGISPEAQPFVFDRFYREDTSRSRDTGGAGLGLASCKSIVDSAQGSISLESIKGGGTTVTVAFRLA